MSKYCIRCGTANANTANVCARCGGTLTGKGRQPGTEQIKKVSGNYLKRLIAAFSTLLNDPVGSGRRFVALGNSNLYIGFLAVQALLSSVFTLLIAKEINGVLIGYEAEDYFLSYPKVFLITMLGSVTVSFVIAGLLYLTAIVFQEKMTYGKALHIMAVRSVGINIILVLSIVVACLNLLIGFVIFASSWLGGLVFMIPVIRSENKANADRTPYIAIVVTLCLFVVLFLWIRFSLPLYAPPEIKAEVEQMIKALDDLKNLGNNLNNRFNFWW